MAIVITSKLVSKTALLSVGITPTAFDKEKPPPPLISSNAFKVVDGKCKKSREEWPCESKVEEPGESDSSFLLRVIHRDHIRSTGR
jgi:hypothetical protein